MHTQLIRHATRCQDLFQFPVRHRLANAEKDRREDGRVDVLKACDQTVLQAGNAVVVITPTGGGLGRPQGEAVVDWRIANLCSSPFVPNAARSP
jgi:hypothetical protein